MRPGLCGVSAQLGSLLKQGDMLQGVQVAVASETQHSESSTMQLGCSVKYAHAEFAAHRFTKVPSSWDSSTSWGQPSEAVADWSVESGLGDSLPAASHNPPWS